VHGNCSLSRKGNGRGTYRAPATVGAGLPSSIPAAKNYRRFLHLGAWAPPQVAPVVRVKSVGSGQRLVRFDQPRAGSEAGGFVHRQRSQRPASTRNAVAFMCNVRQRVSDGDVVHWRCCSEVALHTWFDPSTFAPEPATADRLLDPTAASVDAAVGPWFRGAQLRTGARLP
jgi:hypothetical protein